MENKDKVRGCIVGLAVADAIGYQTEFILSMEDILSVFGEDGVLGPPPNPIYTDDTQMTISVAQALLDTKNDDVEDFMTCLSKRFLEWFESQSIPKNRRAPGNTCLVACKNLSTGSHWSISGVADSAGCGSAMRSAPIGIVLKDIGKIVDYSINSSRITHGHELALCGATTTSLLVRYALDGIPIGCWGNELLKVVSISERFKSIIRLAIEMAAERQEPNFVLSDECLGGGWTGHEAVASALYCCLMCQNSYKDAVLMAVNTVGDSDSIACITGAIMGARLGVGAIPKEWFESIENRDFLVSLSDKLAEKDFKSQSFEFESDNLQIAENSA